MSTTYAVARGAPDVIRGTVTNRDGSKPDLTGKTIRVVASRGKGHARVLDVDAIGGPEGAFEANVSATDTSKIDDAHTYWLQVHVLNGSTIEAVYPTDQDGRAAIVSVPLL